MLAPFFLRSSDFCGGRILMWAAAVFVALELLEGAIQYVGGKLMASAMGDATITDVRTWIREAVAELEAFVSAELRRQLTEMVMNQMVADLEGIIKNLNEYAALEPDNDDRNRFLLEGADLKTGSLVSLALDYDQALFTALTAMAYRLATLFALFKIDGDHGHITTAKSEVDDFVQKVSVIRDRVNKSLSPETRLTIQYSVRPGTWNNPIIRFRGLVFLDGRQASSTEESQLLSDVEQKANQIRANLAVAVIKQQTEFHDKVNSGIKLTATCYNDMCHKIGGSYPIPAAVSELLVPKITSSLLMRGAVILHVEPSE
jgi:hypothetical protein